MPSITHSDRIKNTAIRLATVSDEGQEKITNEMLSMAAKEMRKLLGAGLYTHYVKMFSDPQYEHYVGEYDRTKDFHELTDDERELKNHELAESYLLLYYLTPALKELQESMSISPRTTFGEGTIYGSSVLEIDRMRQQFYNSAVSLIQQITETSGMFVWSSTFKS